VTEKGSFSPSSDLSVSPQQLDVVERVVNVFSFMIFSWWFLRLLPLAVVTKSGKASDRFTSF
jgi:hypothetical protein